MALSQALVKAGLSERWLIILKDELGVESMLGLQYIGRESYPLLLQFVGEPREKLCLLKLLGIEANKELSVIDYNRRFLQKTEELQKALKKLEELQGPIKYRQDSDVRAVETHCQEILQVPESAWIREEFILSDVIENVSRMVKCFETTYEDEDFNELAFLLQVSGGLSLESIGSIVLKGVRVIEEFSNFELCSSSMLKAPTDIKLNFPLRPLCTKTEIFKSRKMEKEFFIQLAKIGCSLPNPDAIHNSFHHHAASEAYCSTIKYCFIPMASYYFGNHQLFLSDYALSKLSRIDRLITSDKAVEKDCEAFFNEFGSHCLQGPFHFGGLYICKCYSSGFPNFANVEEIQREAIDAQMAMCFSNCYEEICVSQLKGVPGHEKF